MRATKAVIHLERLYSNIKAIRTKIGPKPAICIPIKADAYGHGATRIAVAAIKSGATYLAVASVQEGIELRESGIVAPILLFSLPIPEELATIVEYRITPLIPDKDFARLVAEAAQKGEEPLAVHLKIDTGMGRIGCRPEEAAALTDLIAGLPALHLEGTATHLAVADSEAPKDRTYTAMQLTRFREALEAISAAGHDPGLIHAANSGAVALHEDSYFDMVRPGLLAYGYPPLSSLKEAVPVLPIMEFETQIVFIKQVRKGESLSYGLSWTADRETLIATLPVGYADGLPRSLSGRLSVLIKTRKYPLVGRICMDQCMVDLGPDTDIKRWDQVTIFGADPHGVSAADIAAELNTIPYEITCGINKRVPRIYIE